MLFRKWQIHPVGSKGQIKEKHLLLALKEETAAKSFTVKFLYSGDHFYFAEDSLWKILYSNAGAGRISGEIFCIYGIECCKISNISKETSCLYNICKCCILTVKRKGKGYSFGNHGREAGDGQDTGRRH